MLLLATAPPRSQCHHDHNTLQRTALLRHVFLPRYPMRGAAPRRSMIVHASGWRRVTDFLARYGAIGKVEQVHPCWARKCVHAISETRVPSEGLGLSLFFPATGLPPDGQYLTEQEATCDPAEAKCTTPINVWEDACRACDGTGQSRMRRRGRSRQPTMLGVCISCQGIGIVRRASVRIAPETEPNRDSSTYLTAARVAQRDGGLQGVSTSGRGGASSSPSSSPSANKRPGLPSLGQLKARAQRKAAGKGNMQHSNDGAGPSSSAPSSTPSQQSHATTPAVGESNILPKRFTPSASTPSLTRLTNGNSSVSPSSTPDKDIALR